MLVCRSRVTWVSSVFSFHSFLHCKSARHFLNIGGDKSTFVPSTLRFEGDDPPCPSKSPPLLLVLLYAQCSLTS